ncbi:MAG: hypothetical protein EBW15_05020 [Actinobacteria bacterium]|nr:hypothetical protein [Actinomycetota bacterium]
MTRYFILAHHIVFGTSGFELLHGTFKSDGATGFVIHFLNAIQINFIGKDIDNFDDLASVIQNMDLVISTDTSIPHLAAALGKKVFILLGKIVDWRWMLNTKTSPWYTSAILLRKKFNSKNKTEDWSDAFDEIIQTYNI